MSTSASHPLAGRLLLNNLALAVADLPRVIDWYQRVLGFVVEERGHFEPVAADFAMLVGAGVRLELVASRRAILREVDRTPPPRHLQVLGWKALVLQCDDLAALGEHLRAEGVELLWEAQPLNESRSSTLLRDPEGNLINIFGPRR
ncbi:glyoxalase/bleomycin resistance protein/dioxygenase [Pseudomonas knackmussii B13]|uniref:Glyoxalase/bleomycin resistance protein/dioxygenase n=1 Tax=Pseudomonas knackmussii (strain DSM 6978 / CCUG 54928 / LMG 23759 / B13) TaxID=1301098 RepID=A0A024HH21_PSEKB|nr:VOC family protein [Pseudomonas knackmussii]CDF83939.1 glyoxalase/bleomycin resistance protein/dioxygenase [Pseudomonas knackmussii B13]